MPLLPAASTRSLDQRCRALQRANEVRTANAKLKYQLRQGTLQIEEILAIPPEHAATAPVLAVLLAVPKLGPVKAARLLNTARINQSKTIGRLTGRQRQQLIDLLASSRKA